MLVYSHLKERPARFPCRSGMYLGSEVTSHEQQQQSHEQQHGVSQDLMASAEVADSCCSSSGAVTSTRGGGTNAAPSSSRKRKVSYTDVSDDELLGDDSRQPRSVEDSSKKQNHSEIEKRRRDKMNTYITELSSMVPMCHAMSRKLDKLTVLRMAVQHLKTIRGAVHSYTEGHYKPAFLSDQELKHLILQAAEGFLFVVGCDRGRILYVSESVCQVLGYSQGDLLGQSWFDILHPKDVAKVKEQLSSSDLSPRERLIDAKTMLPVKTDMPQGVSRLCPGARRSFFCRMKCKLPAPPPSVKEEADTTSSSPASACHRRKKSQNSDRRYSVIQCTGYLKSWAPAKMGLEEGDGEDGDSASHLSCLVAVGRSQPPQAPCAQQTAQHAPPNLRTVQFVSRHALDGKFLFVDQRATLALGFLPQELLGTSMYEYYAPEDIPHLADSHKAALQSTGRVTTQPYRFRGKEGGYARVQSEWRAFCNPWTRDVECLVAKNVMLLRSVSSPAPSANHGSVALHPTTPEDQGPPTPNNFDSYFSNGNASGSPGGREMTRLINSHVEASKIGRQIAEEALQDTRRRTGTVLQSQAPQCVSSNITHIPETKLSPVISCASPSTNIETLQPILHCSESLSNSGSYIANSALTRQSSHTVSLCGDGSSGEKEEEELLLRDIIVPNSMPPPSSPSNGPSPSNQNSAPSDGNDEAAMAVIMSLLEADAGLGGPVDFSGLPWPLP